MKTNVPLLSIGGTLVITDNRHTQGKRGNTMLMIKLGVLMILTLCLAIYINVTAR